MGNRSLLYSLWQLIWRPGYFISDYINGKRQVSFPPVKMLVLMGVASVLMDKLLLAAPTTPSPQQPASTSTLARNTSSSKSPVKAPLF